MINGTQRTRRALVLATTITALTAPAALAAPVEQLLPGSTSSGDVRTQSHTPDGAAKQLFAGSTGSGDSQGQSRSPETAAKQLFAGSTGSGASLEQPYASPAAVSSPPALSGDGFDWGDAGIGAAAMLAMAAMVAGGTLVLRHRPHRDSLA